MNHPLLKSIKVGFIGAGNMTQALVKGIIESKQLSPAQVFASNRTPGKLIKLKENYGIQTLAHNEEVIDACGIVILAMKPQDMLNALSEISGKFRDEQIIISLAAGIDMDSLEKLVPAGRLMRMMPNTPSLIGRGVIGLLNRNHDESANDLIRDIFKSLGVIIDVDNEDQFDALMVSCSSGTGFVFEMMMYWQDWIEERGFSIEESKKMTVETFLGASMLAAQSIGVGIEELQQRVSSKKGVTAAGLQSMRELEIERTLRISFEKASMRSKEILRQNQK